MNADDKWTVDRLIERYRGKVPTPDTYVKGVIYWIDYEQFEEDVRNMIEWILETDRKDRTQ